MPAAGRAALAIGRPSADDGALEGGLSRMPRCRRHFAIPAALSIEETGVAHLG
jgi:hypothetical protein